MAGAGKHGHGVSDDRRKEGDVLRVALQNSGGDMHQVVKSPGDLHSGDSSNHPHDDQDDVHRNGPRFQAKDNAEDQDAKAAGILPADENDDSSE